MLRKSLKLFRKNSSVEDSAYCPVHNVEFGYLRGRLNRIETVLWGVAIASIAKLLVG